MAENQVVSKERLAIVAALKAKYLGKYSSQPADGGSSTQDSINTTPSQEISSMALHPTNGKGIRGETQHSPVVAGNEIMESVDRCITASLKPSLMANEGAESNTIEYQVLEGQIVSSLPANTQRTPPRELALRQRNRGRWLAVVLRIEFDPQCINLSYVEKAKLAGLTDLSGDDEEDLIFQYTSILNDMEFVTTRKKALEAFESEMDVPTAVCIAKAAKVDPSYAVIRRRLRQMDERYRVGGDQREQFGQIMAFLRGEEPSNGSNGNGHQIEQGTAGRDDEEGSGDNGGLQLQVDEQPA